MCLNSVKAVFVFKPLDKTNPKHRLSFTFDGKLFSADPGMSVAAALFSEGVSAVRDTPLSGSARGPFCMMGACYDCLILVDGGTVQACLTPVSEGLVVTRIPIIYEDA